MSERPCNHSGFYWHASPADEKGWRCVDRDGMWKRGPGRGVIDDKRSFRLREKRKAAT